MEDDDDDIKTIQKRDILDFVKGITNDLIQGNDLQKPDKLEDKVFHAAFLNLRNYLADIIDESKSLKRKNKDLDANVGDLTKNMSSLQDQHYHSTETIEKLRDDIDLKESNERILNHQLQQCKESFKINDTKHIDNLMEYDNLANEMKSQIEFLEQKNNKLSGTLEHLQDKIKHEQCGFEREKEKLYQAQVTYQKNIKNYEKKLSKMKLEKCDFEKGKEELCEIQISYQKNMKDFEKNLGKMQHERSCLDKEEVGLERQNSDLQRERLDLQRDASDLQREKFDLEREKSELKVEKSDLLREKNDFEREKEELCEAQMKYQRDINDFEQALTKLDQEKAELKDAREQLEVEEKRCEGCIREFQKKLVQLTEHVYHDGKIKKEVNGEEKLTNQLLKSLSKVEKLQDNFEEKLKNCETSDVTNYSSSSTKSVVHLQKTTNPINQAMPVISSIPVPIYTNGNPHLSHLDNDVPNSNNINASSMNPATLLYNDLSSHFNQSSNQTRRQDTRHVSFKSVNEPQEIIESEDHLFCNIKEHSKVRDTLLQRKLEKLEESRNDVKWDLCRLEAKIGDAVLKRSLCHNLDRSHRT